MVLGSDWRNCVLGPVVPLADNRSEAPLQPQPATTKLPVPVTTLTTPKILQTEPTGQAAVPTQGAGKKATAF